MPDLFISGIDQKLLDKFTNRINKMRAGGAKKGDRSKYAIQAIEQWLESQGRVTITIDVGQTQEVFEELCELPLKYWDTTSTGVHRHPAIEAMIQQLKERIEKETE